MKSSPSRPRGGFTLVEMLVVITIITILASLTVGAAFMALVAAKQAKITVEVGNLKQAIEQYKIDHGEYPPDFSNPVLVNQHLNRIFRRRISTDTIPSLDPAEALVFFLHGYSNDPSRPVTGLGGPAASGPISELGPEPLMDFDRTRLIRGANGYPVYVPPGGLVAPYVYFSANTYERMKDGFTPQGASGTAAPYLSDLPNEEFVQEGKYQIISAGLDDDYGRGNGNDRKRTFPSGGTPPGSGYSPTARDNVTDFAEGTLESKLP